MFPIASNKRKAESGQAQQQATKKICSSQEGTQMTGPPPQNTLMGLPAELKAIILNHCVGYTADASVSYPHVDTQKTAFYDRDMPPGGWPAAKKAKAETLGPFLEVGNAELFKIAQGEFFRANVFRATLVANDWPVSGLDRYFKDDPAERAEVKHLDISMREDFFLRFNHPKKVADFGQPEADVLRGVPEMYPKLRSLKLDLTYQVHPSRRNTKHKPEEFAAGEVSYLASVLGALSALKRGYRDAQVQLHFRHSSDPLTEGGTFGEDMVSTRIPAEIDGRILEANDLAWQVLDLPEVVVRL